MSHPYVRLPDLEVGPDPEPRRRSFLSRFFGRPEEPSFIETALRRASHAPASERLAYQAQQRERSRPGVLGTAANVFFDEMLSPLSERAADVSSTRSLERAARGGVDTGRHANLLGAAGAAGATLGYGLTALVNPLKFRAPPATGVGGRVVAGAVEGAANNALVDGGAQTLGALALGDREGNTDLGSALRQGLRGARTAAQYGAVFGGGGAALRGADEIPAAVRRLARDESGRLGRRPGDMAASEAGDLADMARPSASEAPKPPVPDPVVAYVRGLEEGTVGKPLTPAEQAQRPIVSEAMSQAVGGGESIGLLRQMAADKQMSRRKVPLAMAQAIGREIGIEGFSAHRFAGMTAVEGAHRIEVLQKGEARINDLVRRLEEVDEFGSPRLAREERVAVERELSRLEEEFGDSFNRVTAGVSDQGRGLAYMGRLGRNPNNRTYWYRQAAKRVPKAKGDPKYLPAEVRSEINRRINEDIARQERARGATAGLDDPARVNLDPKPRPESIDLDARPEGVALEGGKGVDPLEGVTGGGKTGFREITPETAKAGTDRLTREAQAKEDALRRYVNDQQGVKRPERPDTERKPSHLEQAVNELSPEAQRDLATYVEGLRKTPWFMKVINFRNVSLLSGPLSLSRNLIGNPIQMLTRAFPEQAGAVMVDGLYRGMLRSVGKADPGPSVRWSNAGLRDALETFKQQGAQSSGYNTFKAKYAEARGAKAGVGGAARAGAVGALKDISVTHGDLSILDAMERPTTNFGKGPVARIFQAWHDFGYGVQGKLDAPFRRAEIARAHMELSEIRAIQEGLEPGTPKFQERVADLTSVSGTEVADLVGAIAEVADLSGREAVFGSKNVVSTGISHWKQWAFSDNPAKQAFGALPHIAIPFHTVPANIPLEALKRTPVFGSVSTALEKKALAELAEQTGLPLARRAQVMSIARKSLGAAVILAGWHSAGEERVSGGYPKDPGEQGLFRERNMVPNAVKVGAKWVGLAALGPYGLLFGVGAAARRGFDDINLEGQGTGSKVLGAAAEAAGATSRIMLETPAMTGTKDLVETVEGSRGARDFGAKLAGSFVPSAVNYLARQTDPIQDRDVRGSLIGPTAARLPYFRNKLPVRTTPLGRTPLREGGWLKGALDITMSREERQDILTQEFARLGIPLREMQQQSAKKDAQGLVLEPRESLKSQRARRQWVDPKVEAELLQHLNDAAYWQKPSNEQAEQLRDWLRESRRKYNAQYQSLRRGTP